jgi:hypothetical protein
MARFSLKGAPTNRVGARQDGNSETPLLPDQICPHTPLVDNRLTGTTELTDPPVPNAVAPAQAKLQKLSSALTAQPFQLAMI